MKVLNILIVGLYLSHAFQQIDSKELPYTYIGTALIIENPVDSLKTKAFKILTNKCNTCHVKQNRRRVFTMENMNPWMDDVYKQVFI